MIRIRDIARPNLKFDAINIVPVRDIKALVSKDLDTTTVESPLLGISASTSLDGDDGTVVVRRGGHALPCNRHCIDEELTKQVYEEHTIVEKRFDEQSSGVPVSVELRHPEKW